MKTLKTVLSLASLALTLSITQAADAGSTSGKSSDKSSEHRQRPQLTAEQKQLRKDILAKYDANKDGKLDREERAKISSEDKEKLKKAGLGPRNNRDQKSKKAHSDSGSKSHKSDSNSGK
jgi:hypothetical protein